MKTVVKVWAIMLSVVGFVSLSEARSIQRLHGFRVDLTEFNLQPDTYLSSKSIRSGTMTIDLDSQLINVMLLAAWSCPPDALCAMMMPPAIMYQTPIDRIETDGCNVIHYTGRNEYPEDGNSEVQIKVLDYSYNTCGLEADRGDYFVEGKLYIQLTGEGEIQQHRFGGLKLAQPR
jgi:hypothetical protein